MRIFSAIKAIGSFVLASLTFAASAQQIDTPDSPAYHVMIPAGPFSSVNTMTGTLITNVPLIALKGKGRTGLSFRINHHSQSAEPSIPNEKQQVARGWNHNYFEYLRDSQYVRNTNVYNGTEDVPTYLRGSAEGRFGTWDQDGKTRRFGTWDELTESSGTFTVAERKTKTNFVFGPTSQTGGIRALRLIQDAFGNAVNMTYSGGRIQSVGDAGGRHIDFGYRNNNSTYGIAGVTLRYTREDTRTVAIRSWGLEIDDASGTANGRLKSITYPNGDIVRFTYDSNNNIKTETDARGSTWSYDYDDSGRVTNVHPPSETPGNSIAGSTQFDYPGQSVNRDVGSETRQCVKREVTDLNSKTTQYYYVAPIAFSNQRYPAIYSPLVEVDDPQVAGDSWRAKEQTLFDQETGFISTRIDRRGIRTDYVYGGTGTGGDESDLTSTKTVDSIDSAQPTYTTRYHYTANHFVDSKTEWYKPNGSTEFLTGYTTAAYGDPTHTLLTECNVWNDPNGAIVAKGVHNAYDSGGRMVSTQVGSDAPTSFGDFSEFDDQPQSVTNLAGAVSTVDFDALGLKVSETSASNNAGPGTTSYVYDELNRPTSTTYPDGAGTSTVYVNGVVTREVARNGAITTYGYDPQGRRTGVSTQAIYDRSTGTTKVLTTISVYDPVGNLTAVKQYDYNADPATVAPVKTIGYVYDARNKRTRTNHADGTYETAHYDRNGNVDSTADGMGLTTTLVYDGMNRLRSKSTPNGESSTFLYEPSASGLQTTSVRTIVGGAQIRTVEKRDLAGNLASSRQSQPNIPDATVTYGYDYDGTDDYGAAMGHTGRRLKMAVNAQTWRYQYELGRLTYVWETVGEPLAARYEYYDDNSVRARNAPNNTQTVFEYDTNGRTSRVLHYNSINGAKGLQQSLTTTYDAEGNPIRLDDAGAEGGTFTTTYSYDLANRLTGDWTQDAVSGATSFRNLYTYDCLGNRTYVSRVNASGSGTYGYTYASGDRFMSGDGFSVTSYDANGRPQSLVQPGSTQSAPLSYDAEDQLLSIGTHGSVQAVSFVYDATGRRVRQTGGPPIAAKAFVFDGDDVIAETDGTNWTYRTPGVGYVENGATYFERENAQGSVTGTNAYPGGMTSRTQYDAYGLQVSLKAGARSRYGYAGVHGYAEDGANGLVLCGARFYLPGIGRFLTRDPIGHDGGLNLYAYCNDNPVGSVDPKGTTPLTGLVLMQGFNSWFSTTPFSREFSERDDAADAAGKWAYNLFKNKFEVGGWILSRLADDGYKYKLAFPLQTAKSAAYSVDPGVAPSHADGYWHIHPFLENTTLTSPSGLPFVTAKPLKFSNMIEPTTSRRYGDIPWAINHKMIIYLTHKSTTLRYDPGTSSVTTVGKPTLP